MRVRITRDTVADGRPVFVGEVLDLPHEDARVLLAMRKAVPAPAPEEVQVADPVVTHRDPKPARRGRR